MVNTRTKSRRRSGEIAGSKDNEQTHKEDASSPLASPSASQENPSDDKPGSSNESQERPQSPEPNCSICLSNLENKSFTDSCFHQFCFVCLLEWSKVKAECPLCKQPFKSIIHNVRSFEDYDQYHLRPRAEEEAQQRFRYRTTMAGGESWMARHRRIRREREQEQLQRPSRTTARTLWREGRQAATSEFRRRIYQRNMRVEDVERCGNRRNMRFRDITPEFFSRNPACSHRLVPWLNRELNAVLRNDANHVQFVLDLILGLIKRFDIQSEEFRQHLVSLLHRRTDHFIHEFYHFARSPYDLISYDQHAVYTDPHDAAVQELSSDSDSDHDPIIPSTSHSNHVVDLSNAPVPAAGPRVDPVVIDNSVVVLDSDDEEVRPSTSGASRGAPIDLSISGAAAAGTSRAAINLSTAAAYGPGTSWSVSALNAPSTSAPRFNDLIMDYAGTTAPGWDQPLRGPPGLINVSAFLSNISNMFTNIYRPSTSTGGATLPTTRPRQRSRSRSSAQTIDSDVDSIASSHSSDLMVTAVEKPWQERSPIPLSSDDNMETNNTDGTARKKKKSKKDNKKDLKKKDRQRHKEKRRRDGSSERRKDTADKGKSRKHKRKRSDGGKRRRVSGEKDEGGRDGKRRKRTLTISSEDSDVLIDADSRKRHPESSHYIPFSQRPGRYRSRELLFATVRDWMDDIPAISVSSRTSQLTSRAGSPSRERHSGRDLETNSRSHGASSSHSHRKSKHHEPSTSRDKRSKSHDQSIGPRHQRSRSREKRSVSRDRSSKSREKSSKSRDRWSRSRETRSVSRDRSSKSRDKSSKSRAKHLKSPEERYSSSRDGSSRSRERRSTSRDRSHKEQSKSKRHRTRDNDTKSEGGRSHSGAIQDNLSTSSEKSFKSHSKYSKSKDKKSHKTSKQYSKAVSKEHGRRASSDILYADFLSQLKTPEKETNEKACDHVSDKASDNPELNEPGPSHKSTAYRECENSDTDETITSQKGYTVDMFSSGDDVCTTNVQDGEVTSSNHTVNEHEEVTGNDDKMNNIEGLNVCHPCSQHECHTQSDTESDHVSARDDSTKTSDDTKNESAYQTGDDVSKTNDNLQQRSPSNNQQQNTVKQMSNSDSEGASTKHSCDSHSDDQTLRATSSNHDSSGPTSDNDTLPEHNRPKEDCEQDMAFVSPSQSSDVDYASPGKSDTKSDNDTLDDAKGNYNKDVSCVSPSAKSSDADNVSQGKSDGQDSSDSGHRPLGRDPVQFKIFKKNPTGHKKTVVKNTESID